MSRTTLSAIIVVLVISITVYIKESRDNYDYIQLKDDSVILTFGDSLTYGFGVSGEFSYPSQLQNKTGLKVINAGVNGEVSSEGLQRLPSYLEQKPDFVILCHGANDLLQHLSSSELKSNLLKMIELIKQSGAQVMLVGVPDFSLLGFDTDEVYVEVADETGILLENDILTHIELRRTLKSDYVHPNEKGYELMADAFLDIMKNYKIIPQK